MNYQKIYDSLILKRQLNPLSKTGDGSIETHHIIPKCMGGTNDKNNLINLNLREHYIAHLILWKINQHNNYTLKLLCAITKMSGHTIIKGRIKFNSRLYCILKLRRNEMISGFRIKGTKLYFYKGEYMTLPQLCNKYERNYEQIRKRIYRYGYTLEEALEEPSQEKKHLYKGKYYTLNELSKFTPYGVDRMTLKYRLKLGWTIEDAVELPRKDKVYLKFRNKTWTYEEIKNYLNISLSTVKRYIYKYSIEKLFEKYEK